MSIRVKIIQPVKIKTDGYFDHVIIPGCEGDFGVSSEHTPFITKIRPGILTLYKDNTTSKLAIHDGFVTVENNQVWILCDTIEEENEIDAERAQAARKRAENRLKSTETNIDFRRAEAALHRAIARLTIIKG